MCGDLRGLRGKSSSFTSSGHPIVAKKATSVLGRQPQVLARDGLDSRFDRVGGSCLADTGEVTVAVRATLWRRIVLPDRREGSPARAFAAAANQPAVRNHAN